MMFLQESELYLNVLNLLWWFLTLALGTSATAIPGATEHCWSRRQLFLSPQ